LPRSLWWRLVELTFFQIDALLPNVRPKESSRQQLDHFLIALRAHCISIPSIEPLNPFVAAKVLAKQGVAVPLTFPPPSRDVKWKVAFEPPREICVVGSWGNGITVKKQSGSWFGVDLAVEMPEVRCLLHRLRYH
jgi:U3 small nucleolar RNA-associated protein 22